MKLIQPFLTAAVVILLAFTATAQEIRVSGVITDEKDGMPMIGVSVAVAGTTKGTITDLDGNTMRSNRAQTYHLKLCL